jgi:hypothetical protein
MNENKNLHSVSKEEITGIIYQKSNATAAAFYKTYGHQIDDLAGDLAISFTLVANATDREEEDQLSDADYQSAYMLWSTFNSIMAALELFIRGYAKEPQVLTRHALEIACMAIDIHFNPNKLQLFRDGKLNSTKSIGIAKRLLPVIGPMNGLLSNFHVHGSILHSLPQGDYGSDRGASWIGGGYKENQKKSHLLTLSNLILTTDVVSAMLEFVLRNEVDDRRYWHDKDGGYVHKPLQRIKDRSDAIMESLKEEFEGTALEEI